MCHFHVVNLLNAMVLICTRWYGTRVMNMGGIIVMIILITCLKFLVYGVVVSMVLLVCLIKCGVLCLGDRRRLALMKLLLCDLRVLI